MGVAGLQEYLKLCDKRGLFDRGLPIPDAVPHISEYTDFFILIPEEVEITNHQQRTYLLKRKFLGGIKTNWEPLLLPSEDKVFNFSLSAFRTVVQAFGERKGAVVLELYDILKRYYKTKRIEELERRFAGYTAIDAGIFHQKGWKQDVIGWEAKIHLENHVEENKRVYFVIYPSLKIGLPPNDVQNKFSGGVIYNRMIKGKKARTLQSRLEKYLLNDKRVILADTRELLNIKLLEKYLGGKYFVEGKDISKFPTWRGEAGAEYLIGTKLKEENIS